MGKFGSLVGDFNDIDFASGVKGLEVFLENFSGRLGNRTAVTEALAAFVLTTICGWTTAQ